MRNLITRVKHFIQGHWAVRLLNLTEVEHNVFNAEFGCDCGFVWQSQFAPHSDDVAAFLRGMAKK